MQVSGDLMKNGLPSSLFFPFIKLPQLKCKNPRTTIPSHLFELDLYIVPPFYLHFLRNLLSHRKNNFKDIFYIITLLVRAGQLKIIFVNEGGVKGLLINEFTFRLLFGHSIPFHGIEFE